MSIALAIGLVMLAIGEFQLHALNSGGYPRLIQVFSFAYYVVGGLIVIGVIVTWLVRTHG
jgi:hypothetical protein